MHITIDEQTSGYDCQRCRQTCGLARASTSSDAKARVAGERKTREW